MTKLDKLFTRLLANPRQSIAFRDFKQLLEVMRVANAFGKH